MVDYSKYKRESLTFWEEIYNYNLSYPQNIMQLLEEVTELPFNFQYELVASYILTPSALASILPIMVFYGQRGTGKSNLGQFISYIHGVDINTGADTFAAVRNDLNTRRWKTISVPHPDASYHGSITKIIEANTILVWDDIDSKMLLEQPNIFRMLKSGYNKETDAISVADTGGKNLKFNCFSPKICSTTTPFWGDARFAELERRILVVKFGKATRTNLLRLDFFDWSRFYELFNEFWSENINIERWLSFRKRLSLILPNNTRNTITLDIMATGMVCEFWQSIEECIEYFEQYWSWYDQETATGESALCGLLKQYLTEHENKKTTTSGLIRHKPNEVSPLALKKQIGLWNSNGMLEVSPTTKVVNETMNYLGWRLIPGKWIKMK